MNSLDWQGLPGSELIRQGISDLEAHQFDSVEASLIEIARSALERLQVPLPPGKTCEAPNLALREALLRDSQGSDHARYGALLDRLESFLHARERQAFRTRGAR